MSGQHGDASARLIPASPGSYVLLMSLASPQRLAVGALGTFRFPAGIYLYCGSALGSGGLRARVGRHLRTCKSSHWHIDCLASLARLREVWIREDSHRLECLWAAAFASSGRCGSPSPRFGASDCRCRAHLWRLQEGGDSVGALLGSLPFPPHRALAL